MSSRFQAPRGTHDVLPRDDNWWHLVRVMQEVTALYGWRPIQTPGIEDTALFARTSGEASDVVHKEMYTFKDRSDRSLTLRPEGTAPIARAYVEHGLHREPQPIKAYTIAPMYRYGAPGRGRYREHYQLSVEAIGTADPAIDAEIIQLYHELLRRLEVTKWELRLNSIGDQNCRPAYVAELNAWLDAHADVLDEDARHKRATSPLQVFDVKAPAVRAALEDAPKIGESLCEDCRVHFDQVQRHSTRTACRTRSTRRSYVASTTTPGRRSSSSGLTRTRTRRSAAADATTASSRRSAVHRRQASASAPAWSACCSRSRTKGSPQRLNRSTSSSWSPTGADRVAVLPVAAELRRRGVSTDLDYAGRSFKGQMTQAGRTGAQTVAIVRADGVTVRRGGKDAETVALAELADTLSGR